MSNSNKLTKLSAYYIEPRSEKSDQTCELIIVFFVYGVLTLDLFFMVTRNSLETEILDNFSEILECGRQFEFNNNSNNNEPVKFRSRTRMINFYRQEFSKIIKTCVNKF